MRAAVIQMMWAALSEPRRGSPGSRANHNTGAAGPLLPGAPDAVQAAQAGRERVVEAQDRRWEVVPGEVGGTTRVVEGTWVRSGPFHLTPPEVPDPHAGPHPLGAPIGISMTQEIERIGYRGSQVNGQTI